jgi:hypothetical protein
MRKQGMAKECENYHCELYDDDIAVCSYADLCFPEFAEGPEEEK